MADGIPDALSLKPVDYDPFAAEQYANPLVKQALGDLATLPRRAIENSAYSVQSGTYDPSVPVEAALTAMTGGVAGTSEGGMALGAGPIRAYHGSPHDFDKFSMDKIGTGEGAQAYGHGLYFAENPATAQSYKDTLAPMGVEVFQGGKSAGMLPTSHVVNDPAYMAAYNKLIPADVPGWIKSGVMKDIRTVGDAGGKVDLNAAMQSSIDRITGDLPPKAKEGATDAIKRAYASIGDDVEFRKPGRMYEVNINADPEHFLDWDKPLSEQHPQTQDAVKQAMGSNWDQFKFANARDAVKQGFIAPGKETTAANLREAGIPGIKYLDQGSRGAGEGSRNYVVFDDNLINIVKKYGLAGVSMLPPAAASFLSQRIKPVDHNPFAQGGNPALTPVDNDPFNPDQKT